MSLLLLFSGSNEINGDIAMINSFGDQAQNAIPCGFGLEDKQLVKFDLSPGAQNLQKIMLKICAGDPFVALQIIKNKLVYDKRGSQAILNVLSESAQGQQAIVQSISAGDISSIQKILLEIIEKDAATGQQKILQSLQDLAVVFPSPVAFDIFLDGRSIKSKVVEIKIAYSEDSAHNSIEMQSMQSGLFWDCNPDEKEGTSRIEVEIGSRKIYFLLEKRTGNELSFTLWGRSLSAIEDGPYAETINYSLTEPKSAEETIEDILTTCSLDWQCDDWILPVSFEFEGTPMDGIVQITSAIGAVVRCRDDGTIYIRQKFPVRPVDMNGAAALINYDRANLTRLDYSDIKGENYNAVEVIGNTDDVFLPDIVVEESSPEIGNEAHIRVYWAGKKPSTEIETYVTDGIITLLGEETKEEDEAETITFLDGVASVSRPITEVISIEWIGDPGGDISYEQYSKEVTIADEEAYRLAAITYKTTYSRYRISEHYVDILLALLSFGGESDVSVEVKTGLGDRPAPAISQSLLTTQSIAVVAGTAWLDENKYNRKKVTLETPYKDDAVDGILVYLNDAEIDCSGNYHVESCNIVISGPRLINELGVVQCQV